MGDSYTTTVVNTSILINRKAAILNFLCTNENQTHSSLSQHLRIPLPTVHRLCTQLKEEGYLIESGENKDGRGRPVRLLNFNSKSFCTVALDLHDHYIDAAVLSLDTKVLYSRSVATSDSEQPATQNDYIHSILSIVNDLHSWADENNIPYSGIGVSVPGIVRSDGMIDSVAELNWNRVPLQSILQSTFSGTILLENNANAAAVGESISIDHRGKSPLVNLLMHSFGIGSGIIYDGKLLKGYHGSSGEVGYNIIDTSAFKNYYGSSGDLEQRIYKLVKDIDLDAQKRMELYDIMALIISNLSVLIDPEVIVLNIDEVLPVDEFIKEVNSRLIGRIPSMPTLVSSKLKQSASLIGVGELIANKVRGDIFNE